MSACFIFCRYLKLSISINKVIIKLGLLYKIKLYNKITSYYMKKRKVINNSVIFIIIIAIGFGGLFYYRLNKLQDISVNKKALTKEKNNLISKVSDIYLFPEGEIPTIATVSDPALIKEQGFFGNSLKGDKVLIFTKAGKAILYRPDLNKIVEIVSIKNSVTNNDVSSGSGNLNVQKNEN